MKDKGRLLVLTEQLEILSHLMELICPVANMIVISQSVSVWLQDECYMDERNRSKKCFGGFFLMKIFCSC